MDANRVRVDGWNDMSYRMVVRNNSNVSLMDVVFDSDHRYVTVYCAHESARWIDQSIINVSVTARFTKTCQWTFYNG